MSAQPFSSPDTHAIPGNSVPFALRYVGIDLAINGPHVFVCLDQHFQPIGPPLRARYGSLELDEVLAFVRKGLPDGAPVYWIMEPTGGAWPTMVAFLVSRGERFLFMPSTRRSCSLRKSLSPTVKNDAVDAMALAKSPVVDHRMLPLSLPSPALQALRRLVNLLNHCSDEMARVKLRLRAAVDLYNPGALRTILGDGDFTPVIIRFIQECWDPRTVLSEEHLREILITKGRGPKLQEKKLQTLWQLIRRNAELLSAYDTAGHLPAEPTSLAFEITSLLDQFKSIELRRQALEVERERWMNSFPGGQSIQTLYGIGGHIAAEIIAYTGDISRFKNLKSYKCYVGLICGSVQSGGDKPAVNTTIHRRGSNTLKQAFYLAAKTAVRWDPQLAEFARRLQDRHKEYAQVMVAVANKLVSRVYSLLKRSAALAAGEDAIEYQLMTPEHHRIAPEDAKTLIDAQYRMKSKRCPNPPRGEVTDAAQKSDTGSGSQETDRQPLAPAYERAQAQAPVDTRTHTREPPRLNDAQASLPSGDAAQQHRKSLRLPPTSGPGRQAAFRLDVELEASGEMEPAPSQNGATPRDAIPPTLRTIESGVLPSLPASTKDWNALISRSTVSEQMRERLRVSVELLMAEDVGSLWSYLQTPQPEHEPIEAMLKLFLKRQEMRALRR